MGGQDLLQIQEDLDPVKANPAAGFTAVVIFPTPPLVRETAIFLICPFIIRAAFVASETFPASLVISISGTA